MADPARPIDPAVRVGLTRVEATLTWGWNRMSDQDVDYYAVLGISPQASPAAIARAYRRRLRHVHPDTRPDGDDQTGAGEALALLREAFAVLADPTRRDAYDRRARPAPQKRRAPAPPRPSPPTAAPAPGSYLTGPPDPPLRAGPVRYRPSPPPGGDR